jgi:hypothetical protein
LKPEDVMWLAMNSPHLYPELKPYRKDVDFNSYVLNRIPQLYPPIVKKLWDFEADFKGGGAFDKIVTEINNGNKIQLCLKNPGHYIGAYDYDHNTNELVCHDPNHKFGERYTRISEKVFNQNIHMWYVIYYKKSRFPGHRRN